MRTAAPLATSARPVTNSASSSAPLATATASSASASAGRGGSVPPVTCRVHRSPGGPTACSSVTASPRTPRAATQRWGNLGHSHVLFSFIFLKSPSLGCSHVVVFCCFFLFLFSFSQGPNLVHSYVVVFSFFFFFFLKSPGLGCSHVFSSSQKPISGPLQFFSSHFSSFSQNPRCELLPCSFFSLFFLFLRSPIDSQMQYGTELVSTYIYCYLSFMHISTYIPTPSMHIKKVI